MAQTTQTNWVSVDALNETDIHPSSTPEAPEDCFQDVPLRAPHAPDTATLSIETTKPSLEMKNVYVDPDTNERIQEWSGQQPHQWRLLCGQAKDALRILDTASVDCVVTSPPYFWLRDYKVDGQLGQEDSVNDYVLALSAVMTEVYRVLKPTGTLFLNIGDTFYSGKGQSQSVDKKSAKRRFGLRAVDKSGGLGIGLQRKSIIGIPWRVAIHMCQDKWVLRSPIIWHRLTSLPEAVKDRPARGYENIFFFVKSRHYYFNKEGLPKTGGGSEDVWGIPARAKLNGARETAPFPDELVEQCLAIGCPNGGTVLDPFCGSGTTMRVALRKGFPVIGIELNSSFCSHILNDLRKLIK